MSIQGDMGRWVVVDQVANWDLGSLVDGWESDFLGDFGCGPTANSAGIVLLEGDNALKLTARSTDCAHAADIISVHYDTCLGINTAFCLEVDTVPITPHTWISFYEIGELVNAVPSDVCFKGVACDAIYLSLTDGSGYQVMYILQNPGDELLSVGPLRQVALSSSSGRYERNLFRDFTAMPGFEDEGHFELGHIEFGVSLTGPCALTAGACLPKEAWAIIDDIIIAEKESSPPVADFGFSLGTYPHPTLGSAWGFLDGRGWFVKYAPTGALYTFDASVSYDPDNREAPNQGIELYEWRIDGPYWDYGVEPPYEQRVTEPETASWFIGDGTYTVELTVTDGEGDTTSTEESIEIVLPEYVVSSSLLAEESTMTMVGPVPVFIGGAAVHSTNILYKLRGKYVFWNASSGPVDMLFRENGRFFVDGDGRIVPTNEELYQREFRAYELVGGYERLDTATWEGEGAWGFAEVLIAVFRQQNIAR